MTSEEWALCEESGSMLRALGPDISGRKARLFEVACARALPGSLEDNLARRVLDLAERFADDPARPEGLEAGASAVHDAAVAAAPVLRVARDKGGRKLRPREKAALARAGLLDRLRQATRPGLGRRELLEGRAFSIRLSDLSHLDEDRGMPREWGPYPGVTRAALAQEAMLVRDVFPDRARAARIDAACLTPAVVALACAAYAERLPSGELDPDRLAVLADAVEEAGGPADLVAHLRLPGPHVRGCWALDLILGKS